MSLKRQSRPDPESETTPISTVNHEALDMMRNPPPAWAHGLARRFEYRFRDLESRLGTVEATCDSYLDEGKARAKRHQKWDDRAWSVGKSVLIAALLFVCSYIAMHVSWGVK